MKRMFSTLTLLSLLSLLASGLACAQYPSKSIRLIVGFPPGGSSDAVTRILGQALSQSLGQPVTVENKPGADGAIGADAVIKAAPDGYTLMYGTASAMTGAVALRKTPPYDPVADFTPISLVGGASNFLFVHSSVPAMTLSELLSYARANPDKLNFGGPNPQAFLLTSQIMKQAGIKMVHVPYKGEGPNLLDLVAGRVEVGFISVTSALSYVKEGKLRVLTVALDQRSPIAPEVPTLAEAGMPEVKVKHFGGLYGPPKLPRDIVDRLSRETNALLNFPDVREQLQRQGYAVKGSSPEGLAAVTKENLVQWKAAVHDSGMALE